MRVRVRVCVVALTQSHAAYRHTLLHKLKTDGAATEGVKT